MNEFCDRIVFVEARADPLARALGRGWSEQDTARKARQERCEGKRKLADMVIDNSGSEESKSALKRSGVERVKPSVVLD